MKGRVTVEIDFDNENQPVIELKIPNLPEDTRDSILKNFVEKWEHGAKRLFMSVLGDPVWTGGFRYYRISWIAGPGSSIPIGEMTNLGTQTGRFQWIDPGDTTKGVIFVAEALGEQG